MGRRPVARVVARSTFGALRRPTGRGRSGPISVLYAAVPAPDGRPQAAFAVSKRCGGAVDRNLIRRRLRAATELLADQMGPGAYLIRTDPEVAGLSFEQVIHSLSQAIGRATPAVKECSDGA